MTGVQRRTFLAGLGAALAGGMGGSAGLAACSGAATAGGGFAGFSSFASQPKDLGVAFVRGMNLAHLHTRGWGYGSERSKVQAARLYDLGVRNVALNPFAYTRSLSRPEIEWGGDSTMTDDDLRAEVANLRGRGMDVTMKPHLWAWSFVAGKGNGDIALDPAGWTEWFRKYTQFAVHYATLAAQTGCSHYCVGLEYTSATRNNPGAWAKVADQCRKVFGGTLLYAANWYEEYEIFSDWDAFDLVGVNAYFPLVGNSVEGLVGSWQPHLDRIEKIARGKPVVFPEAGYRAVTAGTERPWDPGNSPLDLDVQERGYEALFRACSARAWFGGIWWWKWFTDLPGEGDLYVPAEMPAEAVLSGWFRAGVGAAGAASGAVNPVGPGATP